MDTIRRVFSKFVRNIVLLALILLFCPWLWMRHSAYSGIVIERGTNWHLFGGGHDNYIIVRTPKGKKIKTYFDVTNGYPPPKVGDFVVAEKYGGSYSYPHRPADKTIWETLKDAKERNGNSPSQ